MIKIYRNQNIGHEISSDITHPLKNLLETPSLTLERKADFLAKLGSAYLQAKMSAKAALILLRTASLLQPQNPELHCYLASAYFLDGQTDQSIGQCDMALQLDPNFPKAHFIRAIVLDETGRIEEAISAYQKYLSLKPEDIVAYIRIGLAYEKIDKVDEAKNVWRKILQIDPQNTVALNNMRRLEDSSP
ncbi:MAG: tetratricopeptide repeat protein [bacterium]